MADGDQQINGRVHAGTVETVGVQTFTLCYWRVNNTKSAYIRAHYVAQEGGSHNKIASGTLLALANATGGTVTIQDDGAPSVFALDPNTLGHSVNINEGSESGYSSVRLRVTGVLDATIRWFGYLEVIEGEVAV